MHNNNLESIDIYNEESSSSDEIELNIQENEETSLDSLEVKFPDKVQMGQSINSIFSGKTVPKLDFTKVNAQYKSSIFKQEIKDIKIGKKDKDYTSVMKNVNLFDDDNTNNRLNRINADLKIYQKINKKLKTKYDKYKRLYQEKKAKEIKLSNTLKLAQYKIEVLESHYKKMGSSIPTTEDTLNKRNQNNTSMVKTI